MSPTSIPKFPPLYSRGIYIIRKSPATYSNKKKEGKKEEVKSKKKESNREREGEIPAYMCGQAL